MQRHLACGGLHQPVEIDKISSTDKAQWIEKFAFCGIAHDDFARVTGLIADKRREVLRPGRCAEIKIERIKLRAHKLIQHASRENSTLSAAFAHQSYSSRLERP
ncbi:Uncharacterised protein [Shigella sonnei]|nr:Uncharacterised protein [Shigella sonnei]